MKDFLAWILGDVLRDVINGILVWAVVIIAILLHGKFFYGDIYLSPAADFVFVLPVYIGGVIVPTVISMLVRGTYSPSRSRYYW